MLNIKWLDPVLDLFEELPFKTQKAIIERLEFVPRFPAMYPIRRRGRFKGHRFFIADKWIVYYRRRGNTLYIRALWPTQAHPL